MDSRVVGRKTDTAAVAVEGSEADVCQSRSGGEESNGEDVLHFLYIVEMVGGKITLGEL